MSSLNAVQALLFLAIGAFLLPAIAGGKARAIAGMVIAGIAVCGLIVLGILEATFVSRPAARVTGKGRSPAYHQTAGAAKPGAASSAKAIPVKKPTIDGPQEPQRTGASLKPAQYEQERAEIERLWHDAELERRLWHAGSLAGGLFAWLAIAAAYLKFDLRSAGQYRGRLRLATAGALTLATAAAAWAWTQPLS